MLNVKYELQLLTHNNRLIIQLFLGSEIDSFEDRQPKISTFSGENPVQILSDSLHWMYTKYIEILGTNFERPLCGRGANRVPQARLACPETSSLVSFAGFL